MVWNGTGSATVSKVALEDRLYILLLQRWWNIIPIELPEFLCSDRMKIIATVECVTNNLLAGRTGGNF